MVSGGVAAGAGVVTIRLFVLFKLLVSQPQAGKAGHYTGSLALGSIVWGGENSLFGVPEGPVNRYDFNPLVRFGHNDINHLLRCSCPIPVFLHHANPLFAVFGGDGGYRSVAIR